MTYADSLMENMEALYTSVRKTDDGEEIIGYAYGPPWIAQALYMDDIKFDTPEEAIKFWEDFQKEEKKKGYVIW